MYARFVYSALLVLFVASCSDDHTSQKSGEDWVLAKKHVYQRILTKSGRLDTLNSTTYVYKEGDLSDSLKSFTVYSYKDSNLHNQESFTIGANKRPVLSSTIENKFNNNGLLVSSTTTIIGRGAKQEAYEYDRDKRLIQYIKATTNPEVDQKEQENYSGFLNAAYFKDINFNSVKVQYQYDSLNRIIRANATNPGGQLVRTDINIYSGSNPYVTYSIEASGDTIQKINYEFDADTYTMKILFKDLNITRLVQSGKWVIEEIIEDKKNKKVRKISNSYHDNGTIKETKVYDLES